MDLIERQAAIDILDAYQVMIENGEENPYSWARLRMSELSSAQPEQLTDYSFEESCTDCPAYDTKNHRCPRFNQVIRMALKDANLEACEDCISRQAAIDAIDAILPVEPMKNEYTQGITCGAALAIEYVKQLPSAQPQKRTEERMETHACDLIERQKAIDALADMHCKSDEDGYVWIIRSDAWARIDALPSVTPERKTGKWIRNDNNTWSCDQCRSWIPDEQHYYARYCLYCGAKMEKNHDYRWLPTRMYRASLT